MSEFDLERIFYHSPRISFVGILVNPRQCNKDFLHDHLRAMINENAILNAPLLLNRLENHLFGSLIRSDRRTGDADRRLRRFVSTLRRTVRRTDGIGELLWRTMNARRHFSSAQWLANLPKYRQRFSSILFVAETIVVPVDLLFDWFKAVLFDNLSSSDVSNEPTSRSKILNEIRRRRSRTERDIRRSGRTFARERILMKGYFSSSKQIIFLNESPSERTAEGTKEIQMNLIDGFPCGLIVRPTFLLSLRFCTIDSLKINEILQQSLVHHDGSLLTDKSI